MATFTSFTEILAWQKARNLSKAVFELTCKGTFSKDFGLKDQINRATGSIMDNIAEGFNRGSKNEFTNFLSYSKGSTGEALSQLYRALDRRHITIDEFNLHKCTTEELLKMIGSFMIYLNSTEHRGLKFKDRI
jgi:four helix bundle protein